MAGSALERGVEREPFLLVVTRIPLLQDVKYIQTDGYRAPEAELQNCLAQAGLQSDAECTSAVDLWSLGIILLEMFSGMKLKHTVRSQEWKVPAECGVGVSAQLTGLWLGALLRLHTPVPARWTPLPTSAGVLVSIARSLPQPAAQRGADVGSSVQ